jgi:aspartyl protease family protein
MRRPNWLWFLAFGLGLAVLIAYLFQRFPGAIDSGNAPNFVYGLLLLALVGSSVVVHFRARPGTALKQAAVWVAIGLVLVIGYSYRDVFAGLQARLGGELLPSQGQAIGDEAVTFRARDDGHFQVEAMVDGKRILFMVDTGASDVVLTRDDAERLGLQPESLDYSRVYETANGTGYGAPVRLGEIVVGPIRLTDVRASVNQAPMDRSLLGMSFLGRLGAYEVRGDRLTLWR